MRMPLVLSMVCSRVFARIVIALFSLSRRKFLVAAGVAKRTLCLRRVSRSNTVPAQTLNCALSVDEAIDLAINCADAIAAADTTEPENVPLTAREVEVARLVGRGMSNKEIAAALVVSVRTAEAHITNVLSKLGLHSRAQLAVWAVEHRLVADDAPEDSRKRRAT
jgi:DNA-binding NarL/FixJ family response regulator